MGKAPITSTPSDSSRVVPTTVAIPAATSSSSTSTAAARSSAESQTKQRVSRSGRVHHSEGEMPAEDIPMSEHPLVDGDSDNDVPVKSPAGARSKWIVLAIASGACAAFNGVFAKLATGELTSSISKGVAHFLDLSAAEGVVNVVVRCIFFGLNLAFNGIMWTLFTKALARGTSTTQVSIMNTSANFVLTAVLGFAIFSEALPPLWWLGAALLVAGNVIIGQKDEGSGSKKSADADGDRPPVLDGEAFRDVDDYDRDVASPLAEASPAEDGFGAYRDAGLTARMLAKQLGKEDDEDVLDLGEVEHR